MKPTQLFCALGAFLTLTSLATTASAQYTVSIIDPVSWGIGVAGIGSSNVFQVNSAVGQGINLNPYNGELHAIFWPDIASPENIVDLNPDGFSRSIAWEVSGTNQTGYGFGAATGGNWHALYWSGSAASAIDLNPAGFTSSRAFSISGSQQAGYGSINGRSHALLWSGSAASAVDLHPARFTESYASGIYGTQQVGYGYGMNTGFFYRALLWSGTAASVVNLNPPGFNETIARGIYGGQQVGQGYGSATGGNTHALLWSGSAASAIDLNPAGFTSSVAVNCTSSSRWSLFLPRRIQVGYGSGPATGGNEHALLWSGTAASVIDLHFYLANLPVTLVNSEATSIAPNGDILGHGYDVNGFIYYLLWH